MRNRTIDTNRRHSRLNLESSRGFQSVIKTQRFVDITYSKPTKRRYHHRNNFYTQINLELSFRSGSSLQAFEKHFASVAVSHIG